MTGRREFLLALGAAGVPGLRSAVTVTAEATVFRAHPDGRATLVRFIATDAAQPAGRLRVFDARRALLGTAGMLRAGDRLVGELWLPLTGEMRVRSELEMPGTRSPIHTTHTLRPQPRWTLHWLTLAEADQVAQRLLALPPLLRGVEAAVLVRAGVRLNPLPPVPDPLTLDHLALVRLPLAAARTAAAVGVPLADLARTADAAGIPHAPLVLQGAGIERLVAADATPEALGFDRSRADMARRIEGLLGGRTAGAAARALVILGVAVDRLPAMLAAVEEWNAAYAYPRIEVGLPGDIAPAPAVDAHAIRPAADTGAGLAALRDARRARAHERLAGTFAPLAALVAPASPDLAGLASRAAFPLPGTLVFNPGPFTRSGPTTRGGYATDVPALGYAWLPEDREGGRSGGGGGSGTTLLDNGLLRVEVDPDAGHVRSLRDRAGREWAADGGVNAIDGARLDETLLEAVPGGQRLTVRRVTFRGTVTTCLTLWDARDRLSIENVSAVVGTEPISCRFAFRPAARAVRWEMPGGAASGAPPVAPDALYRWLALDGPEGSVMLAAPDTPAARVDEAGVLSFEAPDGAARYLLHCAAIPSETEPWRLAAELDPLVAVPAAGTGSVPIPTFGRTVAVDEPGVLVAGIKPADDGLGVIVYLHETLGVPRSVLLSGELLRFTSAIRCDLVERDQGMLELAGDSLVAVPVAARGFSAVRLLGAHLTER